MAATDFFADIYRYLSQYRRILYAATLTVIVTSIIVFVNLSFHEDVASMLPDDKSEAALSFNLIQQAPFSKKVLVNLTGPEHISTNQLIEAADRLSAAMTTPFFTRVVTRTGELLGPEFFSWFINAQPNLVTDQDVARIHGSLTTDTVRKKLKDFYSLLLTFGGSAMKVLFRMDPLSIRFISLEKLQYLRIIPRMHFENGHFISSDGRNVLLIADSPIKMTDSRKAKEMLSHFQHLVLSLVPDDIKVSFMSGHRYTLANAEAIKRDVSIVLSCSFLAILTIFVVFLRTWGGLVVFLVPVSVLCVAAAGVSFFYETVSVITIGFGAVLLGISVDFALHVYFALRSKTDSPATALAQVSHPILFCGLTTVGAFGVLFWSNYPVQRELAVFSIIGIGASLLLSLIILPHAIRGGTPMNFERTINVNKKVRPPSAWIISGWLVILVLCIWKGTALQFDGDLRSFNLVSDEIRAEETTLRQTWGNFRGKAVIFAEGADLQSALEANDRIFKYLSQRLASDQIVSLAPILPSLVTQKSNRQRWYGFWSDGNKKLAHRLLISEGRSLGFKPAAFAPFLENISDPTPFITPEELREIGFGELLDSLILHTDGMERVMTMVPDTKEIADLLTERDPSINHIRFASQRQFGRIISNAIEEDFVGFIIKAFGVIFILLALLFRDLKRLLLSLIPVVTGLLFMFGMMGALGMSFNLFNIIAALLIIGLGVDYGIFMVCMISEGFDHATERAVFVSGLTTLAGFGALVLARHPALHSIGMTVLLGISAAIPSALWVIPAIYRKK